MIGDREITLNDLHALPYVDAVSIVLFLLIYCILDYILSVCKVSAVCTTTSQQ